MADTASTQPYPEVEPRPDYPVIERRALAFWEQEDVFHRSIELRPAGPDGSNEYVFYDGPPFANGLPHYGHLLTGYVKDVVPRFWTMRGRRVERRFGWDCHGLPAELEAERILGISGRQEILDHGVAAFNETCRATIGKVTEEWRSFVERQARWVDLDDDYKTMDLPYMESVMWAFKSLWDRGLIYEGYRVMPYSWAVESPVSNFETRLDNSYRQRQDPAITVRFELVKEAGDPCPTDLLAWTTTPWTLPSNLALAVGSDIEYAVFELAGRRVLLGAATVHKYERELDGATRNGTVKGRELVGRRYVPLFPYFADNANSFRVFAADFVDTEEGTGVVHMAPGFGEDDMEACKPHAIPIVVPVDNAGRFTSEVTDYAGANVFDANKDIIRDLKERGLVFQHESYLHNYPHCWRTDKPLIYKALSSWYVDVPAFRDRMVALNQEINWIPEHIKDGIFGNWLEGARAWSISRNRFWGSPLPIWKSDDPTYPRIDVYGSLDELERDFGVRPHDLHRPFIDELTRPNPDDPTGKSTMRRIEDVLDCWFESGSMPYAQVHYPFENREWFEHHFPGDFVCEYVAQTRGWFYTMMVLSTALFDRPPFKNCICHGVVLDEQAKKLSKRLRNYPNPEDIYESHGADSLRWFFMSSPLMRGGDLQIDKEGKLIGEIVRLVLNPIWNSYYFFCLYANADGIRAQMRTDQEGVLDRYILAKMGELIAETTRLMEAYDLPGTCACISSFIDALNNWYIRRSRDRFWTDRASQDKQDAYDTLYAVLVTLAKVAAPMLPLLTEEVFKGLTGERSVHLCDWPDAEAFPPHHDLVAHMDRVRDVCFVARSLREANKVRIRQPLSKLTVAGADAPSLQPFVGLVRDEVNVKSVELSENIQRHATFELQVNARVVGPRLGPKMKDVLKAAKEGQWQRMGGDRVEVAGEVLAGEEFKILLKARDDTACQSLRSNDAVVILDLELSEELIQEGMARDVVRAIQQARKEAGLHVSDRIRLSLGLPDEWRAATDRFRSYVAEQTLALDVDFAGPETGYSVHHAELGGQKAVIAVAKVS